MTWIIDFKNKKAPANQIFPTVNTQPSLYNNYPLNNAKKSYRFRYLDQKKFEKCNN